jgi:ribA/ribD-fused uncharacterized protein
MRLSLRNLAIGTLLCGSGVFFALDATSQRPAQEEQEYDDETQRAIIENYKEAKAAADAKKKQLTDEQHAIEESAAARDAADDDLQRAIARSFEQTKKTTVTTERMAKEEKEEADEDEKAAIKMSLEKPTEAPNETTPTKPVVTTERMANEEKEEADKEEKAAIKMSLEETTEAPNETTPTKPVVTTESQLAEVKSARHAEEKEVEEKEAAARSPIFFYDLGQPFEEFSSAWEGKNPIVIDGDKWPTVANYLEAQKFTQHKDIYRQIKSTKSLAAVQKIVQANRAKSDRSFDARRPDIMRKAVYAKFTQDNALKALLLNTGDREIIAQQTERSRGVDVYWARDEHGHGLNWLGRILMETRNLLREKEAGQ